LYFKQMYLVKILIIQIKVPVPTFDL